MKLLKPFFTLFTVLALLLLAACGSNNEKPSEKKDTVEKSYTIKHAMGSTTITGTPKRVVVLSNEGTEALLALGVTPVGAVQSWTGDPWYDHIVNKLKNTKVVGTESEVNVEAIAALKPDLIIGNKMRQEKIYDQLKAIAPTVFSETLRGDWRDNFELYAKALNRQAQGNDVLNAYDKHIKEVKEKLGDQINKTVSVVRFMAGTTRIYYTDSFSGVILKQLGFERPAEQAKLFTPDNKLGNLAIEVGKEAIPKMDGDIIFYFTYAPKGDKTALDTAKQWTTDPLWKNLHAVKNGDAFEVNDATWNTSGGVLSANIMLEDLEKMLVKK